MDKELDIDVMQNLYGFGGLIAYRVVYFDPSTLSVKCDCITFDEETAQNTLKMLKDVCRSAGIESFMVKFDGAFSKKQTT